MFCHSNRKAAKMQGGTLSPKASSVAPKERQSYPLASTCTLMNACTYMRTCTHTHALTNRNMYTHLNRHRNCSFKNQRAPITTPAPNFMGIDTQSSCFLGKASFGVNPIYSSVKYSWLLSSDLAQTMCVCWLHEWKIVSWHLSSGDDLISRQQF